MNDEDRRTLRSKIIHRLSASNEATTTALLKKYILFYPDNDEWGHDTQFDRVRHHLDNADDKALLSAHKSLFGMDFDETPVPWKPRRFRLFLSHVHTIATQLSVLVDELEAFGIHAFLAHEDIKPTQTWERVIEETLRSCEGTAAFLTADFPASKWTDQEVGFALSRQVVLVPIAIAMQPYGFMSRFHSLKWQPPHTEAWVAKHIFKSLLDNPKTKESVTTNFAYLVSDAQSFEDARKMVKVLGSISTWNNEQLDILEGGYKLNSQLYYQQRAIVNLIARSRTATT